MPGLSADLLGNSAILLRYGGPEISSLQRIGLGAVILHSPILYNILKASCIFKEEEKQTLDLRHMHPEVATHPLSQFKQPIY